MGIRILCIGDVVGKAGRVLLANQLPTLIKEREIDFVVCNAENAAGGSGLTPQIFEKLQRYGVDVVTLGDHCFRKGEITAALNNSDRIVRPANISSQAPGRGWTIVESKNGTWIAVIVLCGQLNMGNNDSPWSMLDSVMRQIPEDVRVRVVDMHAEATSEKVAMGWHANGRASIVFGTHTHVPTADWEILDKGTAFISDLGMTGPYDSILGRRKDRVLKFLTTAVPQRFEVAMADPRGYMLLVTVDELSGKATDIEQLLVRDKTSSDGPYDEDDASPSGKRGLR